MHGQKNIKTSKSRIIWFFVVLKIASDGVILCFRCGVSEISSLLASNAVYYGPIFRGGDGIN